MLQLTRERFIAVMQAAGWSESLTGRSVAFRRAGFVLEVRFGATGLREGPATVPGGFGFHDAMVALLEMDLEELPLLMATGLSMGGAFGALRTGVAEARLRLGL